MSVMGAFKGYDVIADVKGLTLYTSDKDTAGQVGLQRRLHQDLDAARRGGGRQVLRLLAGDRPR